MFMLIIFVKTNIDFNTHSKDISNLAINLS